MIPVLLAHIKTRDHMMLEGIAILPRRKRKTALIWIHGLASRFSSGQRMIREVSSACRQAGIGYMKFNTRGHDIASRAGKKMIGGGFERFEDCLHDIRAMVRFAHSLGYRDIILAGHSTGANKALYYMGRTKDRSVKGLVLLGAISDIVALRKEMGQKKFTAARRVAARLKKDTRALMPVSYGLFSARRFWSLCHPGAREDVFPYYDSARKWKALQGVRAPLCVMIGSRDQYLDRLPEEYVDGFRTHATSTKSFAGIIIKGADHGFRRREKQVAHRIVILIRDIEKRRMKSLKKNEAPRSRADAQ